MRRKLIRQGSGGYTVYLPKQWVEQASLTPGEDVLLHEQGDCIIICPAKRQKKAVRIAITKDNSQDLLPLLTHAYRSGCDTIRVTGLDGKTLAAVKQATEEKLLGFALQEKTEHACTIESISEPAAEKFEAVVHRCILIDKEIIRLAAAAIDGRTPGDEVTRLAVQLDKYVLFCKRILKRMPFLATTENASCTTNTSWEFLTFLMHIGHAIAHLTAYAEKYPPKHRTNIVELLHELASYLGILEKAYLAGDLQAIHALNARKGELHFGKVLTYLEQAKGSESAILAMLWSAFRLVQLASSPLLLEAMDRQQ